MVWITYSCVTFVAITRRCCAVRIILRISGSVSGDEIG